jgi:hypothetical protein
MSKDRVRDISGYDRKKYNFTRRSKQSLMNVSRCKGRCMLRIFENIVTRFHSNAWAAVVGLVETVVAGQRGKRVCTGAIWQSVTLVTDGNNTQQ